MLVFKIVVLSLLSIANAPCQCYEAITDTRDIYVLYENDSVYTLKYFSGFHGEYTLFEHSFRLPKGDSEIQLKETLKTVIRKDAHFYVRWDVGTTKYTIKLNKKNCNKLSINKIPKERILRNPYPD